MALTFMGSFGEFIMQTSDNGFRSFYLTGEVTSLCGVVLFGEKFSSLLIGSFLFPLGCSLIQLWSFNMRFILSLVKPQSPCPPTPWGHVLSVVGSPCTGEKVPHYFPPRGGEEASATQGKHSLVFTQSCLSILSTYMNSSSSLRQLESGSHMLHLHGLPASQHSHLMWASPSL